MMDNPMILSAISKEHERARRRAVFEDMVDHFTKRYRPSDPYDAADFDRQLHSLVIQIYQDAQQPLLDHLEKIMSATVAISPFGPLQAELQRERVKGREGK